MRRHIGSLLVWCILPAMHALADTQFRLEGFDASALPKLFAIFDARSGTVKPPDLAASDFHLLEDGKSTAVASRKLAFRDTGAGLALVVAIDTSRSMEGRPLNAIRQGLAGLVSRKRDKDRVTVLSFADDARWETRWDATPAATRSAFENLRTRGNLTRLYDALQQALDELQSAAREDAGYPPRLCILVLSDGHDEGSRASLRQVVDRLQTSHVRLDAVGLAHSPLWLRNLQVLANAGFGGFRSASTPEDLSRLLTQGIDVLLDSPSLEFHADRTSRDGKPHQFGLEYLPSHWRDQVNVSVPEASWFSDWRLWTGTGVAILLMAGGWLYSRSQRRPVPAVPPVQAAAAASPSPAYRRVETVTETPEAAPRARPQYVPTSLEPRVPTTLEPRQETPWPESKPARAGTQLAPQNGNAGSTLAAAAGPYAGQRFALSADEFWIGSASNNHLCLGADPAVSGNHACIRREEGFLRLYDNGSLNNTMVNGRPIGRETVLLQVGDSIRIGQSELRLEA
jgi:Mg-chelatase subunit ChlD